tara:strand:+ start:5731 stop:6156 length:426 start_codon:yes stop_codon:yes gene_type:complete
MGLTINFVPIVVRIVSSMSDNIHMVNIINRHLAKHPIIGEVMVQFDDVMDFGPQSSKWIKDRGGLIMYSIHRVKYYRSKYKSSIRPILNVSIGEGIDVGDINQSCTALCWDMSMRDEVKQLSSLFSVKIGFPNRSQLRTIK